MFMPYCTDRLVSSKDQKPVPKKRKTKTGVKYETLPDGKYSSTLHDDVRERVDEKSRDSEFPSKTDDDSQPKRYYDCFDSCGK